MDITYTWISICIFLVNGLFGMDITWTLHPELFETN